MRVIHATLLTLGLVALFAGPAAAQAPRGFSARMGAYHGLLANESVQKELKLDAKQVEKAGALEEKLNGEMQEKVQDLEPQERRTKGQEIVREINASALKAAGEFLKPEQIVRLKEIANQVRGAQAFSDPEVAQKLKLTDAQKTDIQAIQQESFQQMGAIFRDNQDDPEARRTKMNELRKQTLTKVEGKLNDEQQKTWKQALGAPFEIKYEQN
jgi:hypothetical protein